MRANTQSAAPAVVYDRAKKSRHSQLIAAAVRLLDERPFGEISIREVAREADISTANAYTYFHSKVELYAALVEEFVMMLRRRHETMLAGVTDVTAGLHAVIAAQIRLFSEQPHLYALVMFEQRRSLGRGATITRNTVNQLDATVREGFAPAVAMVARTTGLDPAAAARMAFHLYMVTNGVFLQAYKVDGMRHTTMSIEDHCSLLIDAVVSQTESFRQPTPPDRRS